MRISGGVLRGRTVRVPKAGVRPTQDSVREAVFSMLQPVLPGCRFLDIYAGSGAVGLEAASRGAACVWWVENHVHTHALLRRNVDELAPGLPEPRPELRCVRQDAAIFLKKSLVSPPFDIIFADPPYERKPAHASVDPSGGVAEVILRTVRESGILAARGLLVLEEGARGSPSGEPGWELVRERHYGRTFVRVYKLTGASQ